MACQIMLLLLYEILTFPGFPPRTRVTRLLNFSTVGRGTNFSAIFEYSLREGV